MSASREPVFSPEELVRQATGNAAGMGYGTEEILFPDAVSSACARDACDVVWAWAIAGTEPAPPTVGQIACG